MSSSDVCSSINHHGVGQDSGPNGRAFIGRRELLNLKRPSIWGVHGEHRLGALHCSDLDHMLESRVLWEEEFEGTAKVTVKFE